MFVIAASAYDYFSAMPYGEVISTVVTVGLALSGVGFTRFVVRIFVRFFG